MFKKLLDNLLLLYLFLLPWQTVYIFNEKLLGGFKWQYGTGQVYATELFLWLIFFIFIIYQIKNRRFKLSIINYQLSKNINRNKLAIVITICLFLLWSALSILWSPEKSAAYYLWLHLTEGAALLFLLLAEKISKNKILGVIVLSACVQALLALSQFFSQNTWGNKFLGLVAHSPATLGALVIETGSGRWLRAYSAFNDPNLFGSFMAVSAIAAYWLYLDSKYKKLSLAALTLISFGLFVSFSRGAWLALAIGLIVLAIINFKKTLIAPLVTIFLSFLVLALILWPLLSGRLDLSNRLEQQSLSERYSQTATALNLIRQHSLVGVGLNNYTYLLFLQNPNLPGYLYQPAHNIYLLLPAELGVVGLIIFLLLIYSTARLAISDKKNPVCLMPLIVLLINGCFNHYFLTSYPGIMLLFLTLTLALTDDKVEIH